MKVRDIVFAHDNSERAPTDLGEVEIFATQSVTESDFCIGLHARFDAVRLTSPDWAYSVSARIDKAFVQINATNCSVAREGRAGAGNRPLTHIRDVETTISQSSERSGSASASVGVDLNPSSVGISGSAKREAAVKASEETKSISRSQQMIEAFAVLTNNRWQVSDVLGQSLFGQYAPEDHLCKIEFGGTYGSVKALLQFYPRDLRLTPDESGGISATLFKSKPNNVAVAKILLARHVGKLNPTGAAHPSDGRINIGLSQLHFEIKNGDN